MTAQLIFHINKGFSYILNLGEFIIVSLQKEKGASVNAKLQGGLVS